MHVSSGDAHDYNSDNCIKLSNIATGMVIVGKFIGGECAESVRDQNYLENSQFIASQPDILVGATT